MKSSITVPVDYSIGESRRPIYRTGVPAPLTSWRISLSTLQASQGEHPIPSPRDRVGGVIKSISRQQLAVEAADRCELGRGLCWVRDDLQDVALQRQDENPASLQRERRLYGFPVFIFFVVFHSPVALDEVEAVLRKTEPQG